MKQTQLLAALVAALGGDTAKGKKGRKAKRGRTPLTEAEKAAHRAENDAECIKAFTKAGYKDVQPRINVKVYGKPAHTAVKDGVAVNIPASGWIAEGRQVKKGEKSIKVGPFNLFHINQTEVMVAAEPKVEQPVVPVQPVQTEQPSVH